MGTSSGPIHLLDQLFEYLGLYWLGQEVVEAGVKAPLTKRWIVPSSHAHKYCIDTSRVPNSRQGSFAVQVRHAKVHEHDFWSKQLRQASTGNPSKGSSRFAAEQFKKFADSVGHVNVVVNYQCAYGYPMVAHI